MHLQIYLELLVFRGIIKMQFKVGDYVEVIPNAKGTVWESGFIMDVDERGAIIGYGSRDCPKSLLMYGMATRVPLYDLRKL